MSTRSAESLRETFRAAPVETLVVSVLPVALAAVLLANGLRFGRALLPSIGFAIALVAFATVATGHLAAVRRRRRLECGR